MGEREMQFRRPLPEQAGHLRISPQERKRFVRQGMLVGMEKVRRHGFWSAIVSDDSLEEAAEGIERHVPGGARILHMLGDNGGRVVMSVLSVENERTD